MRRVVIAGGGFAGVSAAREFERLAQRYELSVTLVDRHNYMLFTPMLPEAVSGAVETRHIVQPFRAALRRTAFELGELEKIDADRRTVAVRRPLTGDTRELGYDELLIGLGSRTSTFGIAGVAAHTIPLKTLADAARLRDRVLGALEVAAKTPERAEREPLLRFTVVGGSFTGVEAAGELHGFIGSVLPYYPAIDRREFEIVIVESGDRLLAHLPPKFGDYARASLAERGIRILLHTRVSGVTAEGIDLEGGTRLDSRTIVWATGVEPEAVLKEAGLPIDDRGALCTREDFSVPNRAHVWAVGDCAAIPKSGGGTYAPLAQFAVREGPAAARNIVAAMHGKKTRPFRYRKLGQMASIGDRRGLAELPGERMVTGFPAWLLWRTYYLSRLPGISTKARVALDWTLGMAFPPEMARITMQSQTSEEHAFTG